MEIKKVEPEGDLQLVGGPANGKKVHTHGLAWFVNNEMDVDGAIYFRGNVHSAEFRRMADGSEWPPKEGGEDE